MCSKTYGVQDVAAGDDAEGQHEHSVGLQMGCDADTHASGKIAAQSHPGICQPEGMTPRERTTIAAHRRRQSENAGPKRARMRGTSCQKLERSTSFLVAPQVMLYENRCARSAAERWMGRPPKKKKLWQAREHGRTVKKQK